MTDALAPILVDEDRRDALLRAVGFDRLSDAQRELALSIAQRYDLDPMLKHLVMIDGRPYITRDGLLHVAHRSNDFDGLEVTTPVLDAENGPDGKRYWRSVASVYRKSFSRPFVYPGRYPMTGTNAKYAEEMAIKVAEVMTLRRAFDVSAPTLEERWDDTEHVAEVEDEPTTLAERVARKAELIEAVGTIVDEAEALAQDIAPDPQGSTQPDEALAVEANDDVEEPVAPDVVPAEASFVVKQPPMGEPAGQAAMDAFATWAREPGRDADAVRATAKSLFPDVKQFTSLTVGQLALLQREVETLEEAMSDDDDGAPAPVVGQGDVSPEYEAAGAALVGGIDAMTTTPDVVAPSEFPPFSKPAMCGNQSPLSDNTCNLDVGHRGIHRASLKETW